MWGQVEYLTSLQRDYRERPAIGGRTVDVDAVAVMRRRFNRGVAMNNQWPVAFGVVQKGRTDPDKVGLVLF